MNLKLLLCTTAIVAALSTQTHGALVTFNDGTEHTINSATGDRYLVQDGPGPSTTTLIVESAAVIVGGADSEHGILAQDTSVVEIRGGTVMGGSGGFAFGLYAQGDGSSSSVSGGTITGGTGFFSVGVWVQDSTLAVSGGEISGGDGQNAYGILARPVGGGSAVIDVSGGTISGGSGTDAAAIALEDNSTLNFTGGTISHGSGTDAVAIRLFSGSATLNFTGGKISGTIGYSDATTLNIVGSDFSVDGNPIAVGTFPGLAGTLSFTNSDGSQSLLLDNLGTGSDPGLVNLVAIPEPSSLAVLGIGSMGLTTVRRRRR